MEGVLKDLAKNHEVFLHKQLCLLDKSFPDHSAIEIIGMHTRIEIKAALNTYLESINSTKSKHKKQEGLKTLSNLNQAFEDFSKDYLIQNLNALIHNERPLKRVNSTSNK